MDVIQKEERDRLVALGYKGMMQEISEGKHCAPTSPYRDAIDALLASIKASEDEATLTRAEEREEITLSISRKALRNSHWANAIAIIATIIAVIAIFIQK
ncbi:MAG: hypothetical protein H7Z70_01035 [Bacteroidia bacterium]|nr:hypothetical protein [Methylotenera sp.]